MHKSDTSTCYCSTIKRGNKRFSIGKDVGWGFVEGLHVTVF